MDVLLNCLMIANQWSYLFCHTGIHILNEFMHESLWLSSGLINSFNGVSVFSRCEKTLIPLKEYVSSSADQLFYYECSLEGSV